MSLKPFFFFGLMLRNHASAALSTRCQVPEELLSTGYSFLAPQESRMAKFFYPSIIQENTISTLQKRQLRPSSTMKYAKSCPWKVTRLGFEHFTTAQGRLRRFRLTHSLGYSAGRNAILRSVADMACISRAPAWPITSSDVTGVQRPEPLSRPWKGLGAQPFWRAADNCSCGSSNSHRRLQAPPQAARAGALGSAAREM